MTDFSCGAKKKKGKRVGTVEECFKKDQIRQYGINALDDGYYDVLLADRAFDRRQRRKTKPSKPIKLTEMHEWMMKSDEDDNRIKKKNLRK